jgi:signal transduction histidine kinase
VPDALLEQSTRDEEHREILRSLGISAVMLVPLVAEGRALGVMSFVLSSPSRSYSALDVSLAEDLARRCAMAVDNARLHLKTLEALRARDEFLAVLSHELRSPLGAILGWSSLLQGNDVDEATLKHGLQVIERNTKTQVQLIQDLLEVSRIITGRPAPGNGARDARRGRRERAPLHGPHFKRQGCRGVLPPTRRFRYLPST